MELIHPRPPTAHCQLPTLFLPCQLPTNSSLLPALSTQHLALLPPADCQLSSNSSVHKCVYTFSEKVQLKQENVWNIVHAKDVTPDLFKVFVYDNGYDIYNPVANVAITAVSFNPAGTVVTFNFNVALSANSYVIDTPNYQVIDLSSNEVAVDANGVFTIS